MRCGIVSPAVLVLFAMTCGAAAPPGELRPEAVDLPARAAGAYFPTFSPDGTFLVWGDDLGLNLWNVPERQLVATADRAETGFYCFSPDGRRVAAGTSGRERLYNAAVYDVPSLKPAGVFEHPRPTGDRSAKPFVTVAGFSRDGKAVFTAHDFLYRCDLATGRVARVRPEVPVDPGKFRVSPDGRWLTALWDGKNRPGDIELINLTGGRDLPIRVVGRQAGFSSVGGWTFAHGGRRLYASDQMNGILYAWSLPDGKQVGSQRIPELVFFSISDDGRRLLVTQRGERDVMPVYQDGRVVARLQLDGPVHHHAISPDGRYVFAASAGPDGAKLWDLEPGRGTAKGRSGGRPAGR